MRSRFFAWTLEEYREVYYQGVAAAGDSPDPERPVDLHLLRLLCGENVVVDLIRFTSRLRTHRYPTLSVR